jgi:hypothetical protein
MLAHSYPTTPKRQKVDSKFESKFERPDDFENEGDDLSLSKTIEIDDYWLSVFACNSVQRVRLTEASIHLCFSPFHLNFFRVFRPPMFSISIKLC